MFVSVLAAALVSVAVNGTLEHLVFSQWDVLLFSFLSHVEHEYIAHLVLQSLNSNPTSFHGCTGKPYSAVTVAPFFTQYHSTQQLKLTTTSLLPLSIPYTISSTAFSPFPNHNT